MAPTWAVPGLLSSCGRGNTTHGSKIHLFTSNGIASGLFLISQELSYPPVAVWGGGRLPK